MKLEEFKAGVRRQQFQYKSFLPTKINQEWTWEDATINTMLEKASRALSELNCFSRFIPDLDLFIMLHITKEASASSKIEGTQTSIEEALLSKDQIVEEKRDDWQEVQNYIGAMNFAIERLTTLPLCQRVLKETHKQLLSGVRGKEKMPGEYRTTQNWIGGSNLTNAFFIPPHPSEVADLMSDLEKFWHNENINVPILIKAAISHYQFETIHPFADGNGRLGRVLIILQMMKDQVLDKPILYISDFLERNRGGYYDALTMVREGNNIIHWVKFFLTAIIETSEKSKATLEKVVDFMQNVNGRLLTFGRRAAKAKLVISHLCRRPIVSSADVQKITGLSLKAVYDLIELLVQEKLLEEFTGKQKNKMYAFKQYLDCFK